VTYTVRLRGAERGRREYACTAHGAFELDVDLATSADPRPCPTCGAPSERTLEQSVVTRIALCVDSGTGKSDPPPSPMALNTRKMFEQGQTATSLMRERRKMWRDHDRARAKQRGLIR